MSEVKKFMIDTNILLYLANEQSDYHEIARQVMAKYSGDGQLYVSIQILREYAVCVSRLFDSNTHSSLDTVEDINRFKEIFNIIDDNANTLAQLLILIENYQLNGKIIHDANIVASMLANGITHILTNNSKDFQRFTEIEVIALTAG